MKIMNIFLTFGKIKKKNTMKDYHDLYLVVNVLLLASVFKTFRKESINYFELNPAYLECKGKFYIC